jgi:copper resistance protein B
VGTSAFLSNHGEFTGRAFAYYDLPVGDRLILQPAVETEIAGADVPALGIGAGPVYGEAGLRLRYRLNEGFAPYVGINWERLFGRTARMARDEGEDVESTQWVLGIRSYF